MILNVIATWSGDANLLVKLAANLTLDPLLAAWADYFGGMGVQRWLNYPTPLDLVLG